MNDTTTTTDTDIMRRHTLLMEDWMRRVEATRSDTFGIMSHGAILGRRGQLRMPVLSTVTGDTLFELGMDPGDVRVTVTYPDGTTYQV